MTEQKEKKKKRKARRHMNSVLVNNVTCCGKLILFDKFWGIFSASSKSSSVWPQWLNQIGTEWGTDEVIRWVDFIAKLVGQH